MWTAVSRHWYSRASDKAPTTGCLYHHLAILAWPNAQQQLYYYTKSLCVEMPSPLACESIMSLFEPIILPISKPQQTRLPPMELYYVRTYGILFTRKYYIGISNISLKVTRPSHTKSQDQPMPDFKTPAAPSPSVTAGKQFLGALNEKQEEEEKKNEGAELGESRPGPPKRRPLPEDFALRGFPFVKKYFPNGWFEEYIDYDDKYFEVMSPTEVESRIKERKKRSVEVVFSEGFVTNSKDLLEQRDGLFDLAVGLVGPGERVLRREPVGVVFSERLVTNGDDLLEQRDGLFDLAVGSNDEGLYIQDDKERKARIGRLTAVVKAWLTGMGRYINIRFLDSNKFSARNGTLSGTLCLAWAEGRFNKWPMNLTWQKDGEEAAWVPTTDSPDEEAEMSKNGDSDLHWMFVLWLRARNARFNELATA
ncbi:hypothetical protein VTG60DRAFT_234 [Thermothelomyces hinnuleus]